MNYYGYDVELPSDSALYEQSSRSTSSRYKPGAVADTLTPDVAADVSRVMSNLNIQRKLRPTHAAMTAHQSRWQPKQADTYDDEQIAPSLKTGTGKMASVPQRPRSHRFRRFRRFCNQMHPIVWVVVGMLTFIVGWVATTSGASWCTHLSDPGTYGPAHGQVVHVVLGGGDSQAQPSTVYAVQDNGRVSITRMEAGDPTHSQVIPGPDLTIQQWPGDPRAAEVALEVGDYNHDGRADVKVTIYSTAYDLPLRRMNTTYILYGDGKGNLKPDNGQK